MLLMKVRQVLRMLEEDCWALSRQRGSHHIFFKDGVEELINLQQSGSKVKPYQVRQVRLTITRHGLGGDP